MTGELHVACCMLKVLLGVRQVLCQNWHPEKAPGYTHHGLEEALRARLAARHGGGWPRPHDRGLPETPEEEEEG